MSECFFVAGSPVRVLTTLENLEILGNFLILENGKFREFERYSENYCKSDAIF